MNNAELVLDRLNTEVGSDLRLIQLTKDETRQVIDKVKSLEAFAAQLLAQLIEAGVKVEVSKVQSVA